MVPEPEYDALRFGSRFNAKSEEMIPDVTADAVGEYEKGTTAIAAPHSITVVAATAMGLRTLNMRTS